MKTHSINSYSFNIAGRHDSYAIWQFGNHCEIDVSPCPLSIVLDPMDNIVEFVNKFCYWCCHKSYKSLSGCLMWMPLICIYNTLEVIQHPGGEIFLGNIITWRYWPPKVLYVDVEGFWNTHTVRWERTHVNAKHQFYVFMNNLSFFPWEITVQKSLSLKA